ncbi:hypothetical protein HPB48_009297 [Haemaphysalis longicornis]|uniref:Uncharacterized protein n=1 Tax=Haemaphysalis longicornis TaxID=44386 RepID=A0A9J6H4G0_HAELO|nr:hypothetical protein HPB48_009297 [Haemaphysalis longicornis]
MGPYLWPDQRYQSEEEIRHIYAHVNGHHFTTLGFWITTRIATAAHIGTDAYFEENRLPQSFADAPFSYDDVLNTVTMSMLAAHAPFYYSDHNLPGAKYGGLGVEFAKELILAVCSEPVFIDSQADFHRVFETTANESSREIVSDAHASI